MSRHSKYYWFHSYHNLVYTGINYLKYSALWTIEPNSSTLIKYIYFFLNKLVLSTMLIFVITLLADIYTNFDNLSIATDDGCYLAGISVVIFKTMNYQIRRKRIVKLIDNILDCGEELCRSTDGDFKDIFNRSESFSKIIFYSFSLLGLFLIIALIFFVPTENNELPISARYPFDTTSSPGHEFGFFVEICTVSAGLTAIVGMDSVVTILCNIILLQMEILKLNFEKCKNTRNETMCRYYKSLEFEEANKYDRRRSEFVNQFRRCICYHQRLILIVDDFNEIFSSSTFVQILSSMSMICLTGFQVVMVTGQSSNFLKFSIYLSAAVSQLFYVCWIGNELIYQSSSLMEGQCLSNWQYEPFTEVGRLLSVSMMCTKKSLVLRGWKMYTLSMETFIGIMQGSYSVFALLSNVHSTDV